jgi:hypothetical protein
MQNAHNNIGSGDAQRSNVTYEIRADNLVRVTARTVSGATPSSSRRVIFFYCERLSRAWVGKHSNAASAICRDVEGRSRWINTVVPRHKFLRKTFIWGADQRQPSIIPPAQGAAIVFHWGKACKKASSRETFPLNEEHSNHRGRARWGGP